MAGQHKTEAQLLVEEASELLRLGRSQQAVRRARMAARYINNPFFRGLNLSAFLIDAGAELKNNQLVREGLDVLKGVEQQAPSEFNAILHYNLGNGYATLGQRERGFGPGTRPSLSSAVSHLDESIKLDPQPNARANLAGVLLAQGRWIEALDEFETVLDESPEHHSARARRGSTLIGIYNWTPNHRGLLIAALSDHEKAVELAADDPVFARSYHTVVAELRKRVQPYSPSVTPPTEDQQWIWTNKLGLNPCPICRLESPNVFDIYPLAARLEGENRRPSSQEVLELVNSICRSFGTARWMLYKALAGKPSKQTDHVITLKGMQGARHDLRIGLAMAAMSGFYGILSQIAFALNAYFHLGHNIRDVALDAIWSPPGKRRPIPLDRKSIHPQLTRTPTSALSALHQLALSLQHGLGRYNDLRNLRNQLEHHVVVPLTEGGNSSYYVGVPPHELERQALKMGRIAKAAIWYFGAAVLQGEQERLKRALRQGQHVGQGQGRSVDRI